MRKFVLLLLAATIAAFVASPAWAQRGQGRGAGFGGMRGGGANSFFLLSQKSVQEELKLSDDQIKKVTEQMESQRGAQAGLRELSREERQKKMDERAKANQSAVAAILKDDQLKRFKQISLQQRGAQALEDPEVAQSLNLSTEQKDRVKAIQEGMQGEMREMFQAAGGGGDREEFRKKAETLRNTTNEKLQGVLSPEQQAKWKELAGEPFKGEIRQPQRGNRGGAARNRARAIRAARNA